MRVDETGTRSPSVAGQAGPDHLEAVLRGRARSSRATLPLRPWPKWKSSPTTTSRAPSVSTSTSLTKSSADLVGPVPGRRR